MKKFLIIDDHPLFREAMQMVLRSAYPTSEIHEATEIDAAVKVIADLRHGYDLVTLDLTMPGTSGFDGLLLIRTRFPQQPILIVSAHDDPRLIREALAYGISGFVSKSAHRAELGRAIATAVAGDVYLPESYERHIHATTEADHSGLVSRLSTLTPQQVRVLKMLRQGLLNKQIAYELGVGETTVKAHVSEILHKLHVFSRTQIVIEASKINFDQILGTNDISQGLR